MWTKSAGRAEKGHLGRRGRVGTRQGQWRMVGGRGRETGGGGGKHGESPKCGDASFGTRAKGEGRGGKRQETSKRRAVLRAARLPLELLQVLQAS